MAYFPCYKVVITLAILLLSLSSFSAHKPADYNSPPPPGFNYSKSCPNILSIINSTVQAAIKKEARMGASLLRLHFHDCFVNGCDGSVLLDNTTSFTSEKYAGPNNNSARGFEVIDQIKEALEAQCPGVVSCADILAFAARDSVVALGGPWWDVTTGRLDSKTAYFTEANNGLNIPAPTSNLTNLISIFRQHNFTDKELVALSGAHTIGQARCTSFRTHIYNETNINEGFAAGLKTQCPSATGNGDNKLAQLDSTPTTFDNKYFISLAEQKGLLHSDQELFNNKLDGQTNNIVNIYKANQKTFYNDFASAMIKMGKLIGQGSTGQVRKNCRKPS